MINGTNHTWVYEYNQTCRYALGYLGDNPLICIGVNPSTAKPNQLDQTMKRVHQKTTGFSFDSWLMLNLYPQISTNPNQLDQTFNNEHHNHNLQIVKNLVKQFPNGIHVWAAWGNLIDTRNYLFHCLKELATEIGHQAQWYSAGHVTKAGHPRHPLYLSKDARLQRFDVTNYLANK